MLPVFAFLGRAGDVPEADMFRTFNMGLGMIVVCRREDAARLVDVARAAGEADAWVVGEIVAGEQVVTYV